MFSKFPSLYLFDLKNRLSKKYSDHYMIHSIMKSEICYIFIFILTLHLEVQSRLTESKDYGKTEQCQIANSAKNEFLSSFLATSMSHTSCKIEDIVKLSGDCRKLSCSAHSQSQESSRVTSQFGWNLNLCDTQGKPSIEFYLMSFGPEVHNLHSGTELSIDHSKAYWSFVANPSVSKSPHSIEIPVLIEKNENIMPSSLNDSEMPLKWYLNITFYSLKSAASLPNLELTLQFSTCKSKCSDFIVLNRVRFPLDKICSGSKNTYNLERVSDTSDSETFNSFKRSTSQKLGRACDIKDPFACGINSVCRNFGDKNGICECCSNCYLKSDGSCVLSPPTTLPPDISSSSTEHLVDDDSLKLYWTVFGTLFSIGVLFSIGGLIYYGIRYNVINRFMLQWPFFCSRRTVEIDDQVNIFNQIEIDSDDPPLL